MKEGSQSAKRTDIPFELPFSKNFSTLLSSLHSNPLLVPSFHPDPQEQLSHNKYVCPVCQKGFRHKGGLVTHFRVHTGERPFKCPLCQKGFTTKQNMITHQSVHLQ